ncbi:LacI family DNA-binding transcriptional regulator [Polaromonas jejuensis]|uniref:LacI family DNA-binding transcriptional regulator n=1 Tax=Polaromonas jejuensis TaxID=457502 RepID=A0ABW0QDZ8_9BURK|nr:LacI family DNA-binding transcriptional regulator [Polaromonas jejuensis]
MSIQDVAVKAGVSVATVSRVFNTPGKVTPATREHVQKAASALGYVPNASARTLRTQRSRVLGIVLPTLLNPVFAECLEGIAQAATTAGYAILPLTTDYRLELEDRAVNLLMAGNADGMILVVSNPATSLALARLCNARMPYVLAYNQHPDHPCVSVDSEQAVADLVARLASLGHRRITLVSGQLAASDRAQQRRRGFVRGMEAAGLDGSSLLEVPFVQTAVQEISDVLRRTPRPTALVCSNDLLAIRSIRAAHLAGLSVPRDLSVTGFDGIALGEDLTPMLSTITQPNADIGRCSVELLIQALAGGAPLTQAASICLAHAFRTGESCTAPDAATH